MARILLGVSGGIAAYKACELTRLLVKGGHDVVPLVTPGAERFVRAETFLALARRPAQRGSLRAPDARRPARRRAVHGEHARQARSRARRQPADRGGARASRAGARRAGDEPAHVGAPGDARERRDAARARRRAGRARRGRDGRGRVGRRPDGRARGDRGADRAAARAADARRQARARHRRRHARGGRRGALRRQPLVRPDGRRARRGGAAARGGGRPARGQPRRRSRPPGVEVVATPTAEAMLEAAAGAEFDLALLAAAVADYRPAAALATKRAEERRAVDARARADHRHRAPPRRAQARRARCSSTFGAELGEDGLERKRRMLDDKNADLVVFNDVSRADIGFDAAENEVVLVTPRRRAARRQGARSRPSPPRSSTRPSACSAAA